MLTHVIRAQVNDLKKQLKHKICIEKNKFLSFQDNECTISKIMFLQ